MDRNEYRTVNPIDARTEFVRGVRMSQLEHPSHGFVCANVGFALNAFVRANRIGRVSCNSCLIMTTSEPTRFATRTSRTKATKPCPRASATTACPGFVVTGGGVGGDGVRHLPRGGVGWCGRLKRIPLA